MLRRTIWNNAMRKRDYLSMADNSGACSEGDRANALLLRETCNVLRATQGRSCPAHRTDSGISKLFIFPQPATYQRRTAFRVSFKKLHGCGFDGGQQVCIAQQIGDAKL